MVNWVGNSGKDWLFHLFDGRVYTAKIINSFRLKFSISIVFVDYISNKLLLLFKWNSFVK